MGGNSDEKGKCLEKLNELQIFLPFLDFMINKIKKKNVSPLGCQLSKFQYIKSLIIEKNGRYSLEGLINIEDVLQKLVTKLDYKGEKDKNDKKEVVTKSESFEDSTFKDEYSEKSNFSAFTSALAASLSSSSSSSSCESASNLIESSDNAIDILMKTVRMPGGQSGKDKGNYGVGGRDSIECSASAESLNRVIELEGEDAQKSGQNSPKEMDLPKTSASSDVLVDSRKKLLKKFLNSVSLRGHVDGNELEYMKDYHPSFTCDVPVADFVEIGNVVPVDEEKKEKSTSEKEKSLTSVLSDISEDELSEGNNSDQQFQCGSENDVEQTGRVHSGTGRSNGEIGSRTESRFSEPYVNTFSGSLYEMNNKQKLRDRLSADIAEVHRVPGKSVGCSLRSLKDIKEKKSGNVDKRRDSYSKESDWTSSKSRSDRHRNNKSTRKSKDGRGRSSWRENKNKDSHSRIRKHEKSEDRGNKRGFSGSSNKKSSSTKEKKELKEKMLETDLLNDQELADFVKENISALPHLSKLKPDELRRAIFSMGNQTEEERCKGQSVNNQDIKRNIKSSESSNMNSTSDNKGSSKGKVESKVLQSDSVNLNNKPEVTDDENSEISVIDITSSPEKDSSAIQNKPEGKQSLLKPFVPEKIPVLDTRCIMQRPPATQNFQLGYPLNYNIPLNQVPRPQISPTLYQGGPAFPQIYTNNNVNSNNNNNHNINNNNNNNNNNYNNNNNKNNSRGDPRGARNTSTTKESYYSNQFYFHSQGNIRFHPSATYDNCNSVQRHYGPTGDMLRSQNYNAGWNSNYNTVEPKSYGEYKQLRRQEQECINKSRLGPEEKSNSAEEANPELPLNDPKPMEDENKTKDSSNLSPRRNSPKIHKRWNSGGMSSFSKSESRKSFESDRVESKEKPQGGKSSSQEDELISPLEKLYESNPKQVTGRGYGLQKFKIPKKSTNDYQKSLSSDKTCPGSSNQIRLSIEDESTSETVINNSGKSDTVSCEAELSDTDEGDVTDGKSDEKFLLEEGEEEEEGEADGQGEEEVSRAKEIDAPIAKSSESFTHERELWDADEIGIYEKESDKSEIGDNICSNSSKSNNNKEDDGERPEQSTVKCSDEAEKDAVDKEISNDTSQTADLNQVNLNKKVSDEADTKNDNLNAQKSGCGSAPEISDKTPSNAQQEKEKEEKTKSDADITNKSLITEEITQELVEALITKSFESGEGELLLAKAKLFKEIALKLNSKKLKTIQKIINSESDESSSSSDSSVLSEKKKKKTKKKKADLKRPSRRAKSEKILELKNVESMSTSGEEENENEAKPETPPPDEVQKTESSEPAKEEERSSGKNSKKNQRKTKILEQIFNESPTQNFDLGNNQNPSESDPKAKSRGKTKGKTELDRLHEDIRSMFISSGVVTATGQRMCRMLRASGGKVNNLDLVKESAKMVEEEKLASHKSGKKNQSSKKARSRSRSNDRMTLRLRSKPKSQGQMENSKVQSNNKAVEEDSKLLMSSKNQPIVLLHKMNAENFSYAYKITDFPESINRRRGLNVAKRGHPLRSGLRSKSYKETYLNKNHKIYLQRNLKKCKKFLRKGCKTAFKPKKLTDIIQKLPLKMAKIRHLNIADKVGGQTKESPLGNCKSECPENKSEDETLNYAFEKNKSTYTCLICGFNTKTITGHYLGKHPESEVLISRLNAAEAEKAVADSKANNYDMTGLEQACTLEVIKRRVKSKLSGSSNYSCRMCTYGTVIGLSQFSSHVSTHTGEYRYKCPIEECNIKMASREYLKMHMTWKHTKHKNLTNKAIEVFPLPSEGGILFGYLCSRCNFVQLLKENIENHILKTHSGAEDVRIIKIDMSAKPEDGKGKMRRKRGKKKKKAYVENKNISDKEDMDQSEDGGESNDDAVDEDYMYISDETRSYSSTLEDDYSNSPSEDDFDEFKPSSQRIEVDIHKRNTRKLQKSNKGKEVANKVLPNPESVNYNNFLNNANDSCKTSEGEKERSQVNQENKDTKEGKETKETPESKKSKENKETAESKKSKENKETAESKKSKENKETAESKKSKENKETVESKRSKEDKETVESKRSKEDKETVESKRSKEDKETVESKRSKEDKETVENKRAKENKETSESKRAKDNKETVEGKRAKDSKETIENKRAKDNKETVESKRDKENKETIQSKRAKDNKETAESKRAKENKETAENKRAKENKESSESRRAKDSKETAESKRAKENKETVESKRAKENKETVESKRAKENKETVESKRAKENKETSESKRAKDIKETAESKRAKENKETSESKRAKDNKETVENKRVKENKETVESKRPKEDKETVESKRAKERDVENKRGKDNRGNVESKRAKERDVENKRAKESKETSESKRAKDSKETVESKRAKEDKETVENKRAKDNKETIESKRAKERDVENKRGKDNKGTAENKRVKENKETSEGKRAREDKEAVESKRAKDSKETVENKRAREDKETVESKRAKEDKESVESKRAKEDKETVESKRAKDSKETVESKRAEEDKETVENKRAREDKESVENKTVNENKETSEGKRAREDKETVENKRAREDKESVENKRVNENKETSEGKRARENKESVENKTVNENKETSEGKRAREDKETVENKRAREDKETVENKRAGEDKETVENKRAREDKETVESKRAKDDKETVENKRAEEDKETVENKRAGEDKETVENKRANENKETVESKRAKEDKENVGSEKGEEDKESVGGRRIREDTETVEGEKVDEDKETVESEKVDEDKETVENERITENEKTTENKEFCDTTENEETTKNREFCDTTENEETTENREFCDTTENDINISESHNRRKKWEVGPLTAVMFKNRIVYSCTSEEHDNFETNSFNELDMHVSSVHSGETWSGICKTCDSCPEHQVKGLSGTDEIHLLLKHLESHIKVSSGKYVFEKIKRECVSPINDELPEIEEYNESFDFKTEMDIENASFPVKPLLRVRSLVGDRLSKPKYNTDDEHSYSGSPTRMCDGIDESEKYDSEPALFTIKDVRSLNSEIKEEVLPDKNMYQTTEITVQKFPPNAEVVSGEPVLIRSCPSPKITIRTEANAIPIPVAQAKQAVEAGHLKIVPPPSDVTPIDVKQLEFVTTASIRILSPATFTSKAMILPTFTSNSRVLSIAKPTEAIMMNPKKKQSNPVTKKAPPSIGIAGEGQNSKAEDETCTVDNVKIAFSMKTVRTLKPILPAPPGESSHELNQNLAKRQQQYCLSFGGKNLKDVKIYKEMLTKTKLCQLFKCMAVECSFTCNNDTIFTQHIGLHVAQQRIKGKKKPQCRSKKIYNWQQCAYCCEVLVTGTALSQHILTEHGHCLYQCSYCFYRAVSETYVALHQNTIHDKLLKEKEKVIYKCEPVLGAVMKKVSEKPIKPYNVKPYHCELCGTKFYIIKHFVNHLIQKHQGVTAYTCHICKILCFKTDRLIAHYKLHSYSMFQCAYCLHGTETQKEMLFHLCNFHFSQPPLLYGRMTEDVSKIDNVALDDLKLITCDNGPVDLDIILEEVRKEEYETEIIQDVKTQPISVDLSSIVSELGIDVDDGSKRTNSLGNIIKEGEGELSCSISVENILPNTRFSCEGDAEINSNKEMKEEKISSFPIGQLPIEILTIEKKDSTAASFGSPEESSKQKPKDPLVNQLLINLQQKNFSVTVTESKPEEIPKRIAHKLPPTIPMNREILKPKKLSFAKKLDKLRAKLNEVPVLLQPIGSALSSEHMPQQTVLLALPVTDGSNTPVKESSLPAIQNVVSLKRSGNCDDSESEKEVRSAKRVCLPAETENLITVTSPQENPPIKISDVRSLSTDKPILQPPIIRIEDFEKVKKDGGLTTDESKISKSNDKDEENLKNAPSSPEVIIIDAEETKKSNELIDLLDSEDDGERNDEEMKRAAEDGLEIRKQMEMLRNLMENETDCLLLDDTSQNGSFISAGKQEDSRGGLSTDGENIVNEDGGSVDNNRFVGREPEIEEEREKESVSNEDKEKDVNLEKVQLKNEIIRPEDVKVEKTQELFGKDLYKCGIENCSFSAENINDLRDHLYICDFSRQSQVLSCPHCARQFKHNTTYVDHLKNHGEKKYCCGLCSFTSAVMGCVSRHIKQKHRCSLTKTLPYDSFKPGYFVVYPKHYKVEKQNVKMTVFSPGDEDKLPLQSVYQDNVKCAKCPYFTKVRSNMVRHLKIHIKSVEAEGSIVVPSTAPTNPVPCLDTKEKMFDKMTNLAASSQLAHTSKIDTLSSEEEAKLPQFVPEQMRHKCCSPDCNYLTIDDSMLKHHIKALHDEINVYSCPHCKDTVHLEFRFVPLDKIGQHLKYHDAKLYKCCHCMYFHHQKYVVEKHVLEKHPEKRFFVYTVREPKIESASEEEHSSSNESVMKMYKCGLCEDFEDATRSAVVEHLNKIHNTRSKFKCKHCDVKSSQYSIFPSHFASKHNGLKVEVLRCIIQVNRSCQEGSQSTPAQDTPNDYFDTTPLWQRDAPRIRHIRGILIEEEELKTKRSKKCAAGEAESEISIFDEVPPDTFYCPLCTDKKRVFRAKSAASLRTHLYQELNYQQFACILCGKMFVDMKECERHHARSHPNKVLSIKQTKGDSEIMFWVNKVVAKQEIQITEKKRRPSTDEKSPQPSKRRKLNEGEDEEKKKISDVQGKLRKRPSTEKCEKTESPRGTKSKDEPIHKCPHCEFNSRDLRTLKNHILLKHLQMGKWLCKYCNETFNTEKKCVKHCKTVHPGEAVGSMLNPEKSNALNDDFWLEEYGIGRDKKELEQSNVYSCGYCMIEVTDQSSIIDHFEKHHKTNRPGIESEVLGSIYYKCNVCSNKISDFESLNLHARKHPHTLLKFQVRKIYRYEDRKSVKSVKDEKIKKEIKQEKNDKEPKGVKGGKDGKGSKDVKGGKGGKGAKEGSCKCPKCSELCDSYIDCIDHFNEHYERYSCGECEMRFFTEQEIEKHRKESKHSVPYILRLPSEEALEEYKSGIMVVKNRVWLSFKEVLEENRKNKSGTGETGTGTGDGTSNSKQN